MDQNNVIFGAEFDPTGYKKGAQEIVDQLHTIKAANDELITQTEEMRAANLALQKSNEDLAKSMARAKDAVEFGAQAQKDIAKEMKVVSGQISDTEKRMKQLEGTLAKNKSFTKAQADEYTRLKGVLPKLNADLTNLERKYEGNKQKLAAYNAELKKGQADLAGNTATIKANTEAMKVNEAQVKKNEVEIKKTNQTLDGMKKSSAGATKAVSAFYGGLKTAANILPGLGIAGLITLMYELGEAAVTALMNMGGALSNAERAAKLTAEIGNKAADSYGKEKARLDLLVTSIQSETTSRKEKFKLLEQLQKEYPGYFDNIKTETDLTDKLTEAYNRAARGILAKASANAAEGLLSENIAKRLKAETDFRNQERTAGIITDEGLRFEGENFGKNSPRYKQLEKQYKDLEKLRSDSFGKQMVELEKDNDFLIGRIMKYNKEILDLGGKSIFDTGKGTKGVENVFRQKLLELRARLAAVQASEFQSEPLIRKKFEEQLNKEFGEIEKLLKDKKLTAPQAGLLKGILSDINETELSKSLEEFRKKQEEALKKVNDIIYQNSVEAANKRIANIRDEFDRDRQQIELSFNQTTDTLQRKLQELIKTVDEEVAKGLLNPKQGKEKKGLLTLIFGDLTNQAEVQRTNQELDLAFKVFQNTIKESQKAAEEFLVSGDERTAERVVGITEQYFAGAISYKKYQEELVRIAKEGAAIRNNIRLQELRKELDMVNEQIRITTDPTNLQKLKDQQLQLRGQIANLQSTINQDGAKDDEEANKKRIENLVSYMNAVQTVLSSVASFWNQVNQVEQASLDRSIALQQKRVDNAREIAEKGNAEYLEMELKRMDDLERKREENARRQMAINAALTMSQATVAAIGAIAQAVSTGSPLAAIGALAATIGAIGAAFAFVNSLQPPVATFYTGSEYVDDPNKPRGKDTIPARLNIGERVVTTDKNQKYWDTLTAIHNGTIPPEALNSFVNSYPRFQVPGVDYGRLGEATQGKVGFDSIEIARELQTTNQKLDALIEVTGASKVIATLDENGFALSVAEALNYKQKMKKA